MYDVAITRVIVTHGVDIKRRVIIYYSYITYESKDYGIIIVKKIESGGTYLELRIEIYDPYLYLPFKERIYIYIII